LQIPDEQVSSVPDEHWPQALQAAHDRVPHVWHALPLAT
jgi:hypothetical protein